MVDPFFLLPFALGLVMYFYLRHRSRRLGYDDWLRGWKKVDRGRRRRIVRSVRGGTPLHEPDDARLALELIDHTEQMRAHLMPRMKWWLHLTILGFVVFAFAMAGDVREVLPLVAPLALLMLLSLGFRLFERKRVRKFAVAKAANEAVVDQYRPRGDQ